MGAFVIHQVDGSPTFLFSGHNIILWLVYEVSVAGCGRHLANMFNSNTLLRYLFLKISIFKCAIYRLVK